MIKKPNHPGAMKKYYSLACHFSLFVSLLVAGATAACASVKSESGYINVEGGKLYYEIAGKGRFIVLLHDGMVNREIWDDQYPVLAESYRVVRYDRRGYGRSTDPESTYSNLDDLHQLFLQLKIDEAIVFGMSSGGGLAIDFTLKYPANVKGLVLVGAVVGGLGYTQHMTDRGGHLDPALADDPARLTRYFVEDDPYETYSANLKAKEKLMQLVPSMGRSNRVPTRPPDRVAVRFLSEIKVPALILVGEYDHPDVHAHAGAIDAGIPDSRRELVRNSGHLIPLEQPAAFNERVKTFLTRISY
ncbi:MAG: alpha/beta hydrolase [Bacteroidales bacterium]|jgi:pimeloyl-ACP methyl ester carboxylesterase|nr:alpha/beta hydrolase [Bacteroidales bacterium]